MEKKWWKSYTIWFNVALILVTTINQLAQFLPIPAEYMAMVAYVGNVLLRFKTNGALTK